MSDTAQTVEQQLLVPARSGAFSDSELAGLPMGARRMLGAAIAGGTPLASTVRLTLRGSIRLGRWLPFRSTEVVTPGVGFLWRARVAGVISGFDSYVNGRGEMRWKLLGLLTVASGSGEDVSRSASGREAGESFWAPTALLPRFGVEWSGGEHRPTARIPTAAGAVEVAYGLDSRGLVRSLALDRWGDPEETGTFGLYRFGGEMAEHRSFGGITIPTVGRIGWHFGQDGWTDGEFFRFRITSAELVA